MGRQRKPKQEKLIETAHPGEEELIKLAESYRGIRDDRMDLTKHEVDAREKLLDAMHRHKLTEFEGDGVKIEVTTEERIKVKIAKDPEDDDLGDEEEE